MENIDRNLIQPFVDDNQLVLDGNKLKWANDFASLKNFFENIVGLSGKWRSPGGRARKFSCINADLVVTWYPGKLNSLLFNGKDGVLLKSRLIGLLESINCSVSNVKVSNVHGCSSGSPSVTCMPNEADQSVAKKCESTLDNANDVYNEELKVEKNLFSGNVDHDFVKGCRCRLLAADLEEVKLDMVIMQRVIDSKISAVVNEKESDEIKQLRKELSNERQKCKTLEIDISTLIRGRNREINELNSTITSLEKQLKSSEATNKSLKELIMQIRLEKVGKLKQNRIYCSPREVISSDKDLNSEGGSSSFNDVFAYRNGCLSSSIHVDSTNVELNPVQRVSDANPVEKE